VGDAVPKRELEGFHWVVEGMLAGSPRPGALHALETDLRFLAARGIRHVVSLTEEPLDERAVAATGLGSLHFPIARAAAPAPLQALAVCHQVNDWLNLREPVLFHCEEGVGRTGTMLAALLVTRGDSPDAATRTVRLGCPHYTPSGYQQALLEDLDALVGGDRR